MYGPAKNTTVALFVRKGCLFCDALSRVLLPVMSGIMSDPDSPLPGAGIRLRVVTPADVEGDKDAAALKEHVAGYPTILFVQDGVVVPRHTIEGFPADHDDLQAFGEWFGRYVVAAHFRDI